jgi:HSP20 family protein
MSELELMAERMRRMLDQTLRGSGLPSPSPLSETGGWAPPVDIEEREDAYIVEAEVPGISREDVNIDLIGNELTISGEIKEKERDGILRRRTRRVGRFQYRVILPEHVDSDGVDAKLGDGVLTIRVPKSERAKRRRIDVSS